MTKDEEFIALWQKLHEKTDAAAHISREEIKGFLAASRRQWEDLCSTRLALSQATLELEHGRQGQGSLL